jgi:hypothetical protein
LQEVIRSLTDLGFCFKDSTISYYSKSEDMYINLGKFPLASDE